ncbi:PDR/VanB family oxidoreductase [Yinghuangia seranimata]|uniref:PDR/VanB family oxidoreductase n=1 Tax=Yinghuangia seranimata TaxID=408067 RepID=UPI00248B31A6|nr:PDR/VanB family oxidoreductase [Yinghuangia seranimata]MDI2129116.1 PDR/VanB family oxidoreductase [Yinghuangia seranimata]
MSEPTLEPTLELTVAARTAPADGVVALTLRRSDGGALPGWTPGAHVDVLLPDGMTRQYSLCGSPDDRAAWRVAVLKEPGGRGGSAYVHARLTPGARVRVRGPRNHFVLEPAARYRFIAGGIGITPILPMLAQAQAAGAEWTLLYGGRTRGSMAFLDELEGYGDRVRIAPHDESGLLDVADHLRGAAPGTLVYCCGPGPLLDAVGRCRPDDALRIERFRPAADDAAPRTGFTVVLARSGRTLPVAPTASVLETVRAAGIEVLYSCAEGTCGTCETDVLDGVPDHRDSVLTAAERAAGDTMMICVSRCTGPRLVLDL